MIEFFFIEGKRKVLIDNLAELPPLPSPSYLELKSCEKSLSEVVIFHFVFSCRQAPVVPFSVQ